MNKIGLGGGCHWCTEGIFLSLLGVTKVEQGWIASKKPYNMFSEAIIVSFDTSQIDLFTLIRIHLHTHAATKEHSFREKYRSAIYTFDAEQEAIAKKMVQKLQSEFDDKIITTVLPFLNFKLNTQKYLDYFYSNPDAPFCKNYITPKIRKLIYQFNKNLNHVKLEEYNVCVE